MLNIVATLINIIAVVAALFVVPYIWRSGKNRERLYVIVPTMIAPVNSIFLLIDMQLETASWFWPTSLIVNLIALMAIGLGIGYLWYINKISNMRPTYLFLWVLMGIVALMHMLFSIFYWQLQL